MKGAVSIKELYLERENTTLETWRQVVSNFSFSFSLIEYQTRSRANLECESPNSTLMDEKFPTFFFFDLKRMKFTPIALPS